MKRTLRWAAVVVVAAFAVLGLWSAATTTVSSTVEQTSREVSQSLRCPTCAGESIADSSALLSEAMRQTVRQQVSEGRSPDEIRAWFADRYGDEVLLAPPRSGYGGLLWAVPVLLVGIVVIVQLVRKASTPRQLAAGLAAVAAAGVAGVWLLLPQETSQSATTAASSSAESQHQQNLPAAVDAVAVLQDAVDHTPGDVRMRLALAGALEQHGQHAQASHEYAAAARLRPMDPDTLYRQAFALVRSGDAASAEDVLDASLQIDPDHPPSLLLIGAMVHEEDPDRSAKLLERFVELQPQHPSAEGVRELLDGKDGSMLEEVSP